MPIRKKNNLKLLTALLLLPLRILHTQGLPSMLPFLPLVSRPWPILLQLTCVKPRITVPKHKIASLTEYNHEARVNILLRGNGMCYRTQGTEKVGKQVWSFSSDMEMNHRQCSGSVSTASLTPTPPSSVYLPWFPFGDPRFLHFSGPCLG